jgi:hypothetical protein
MQMDISNIISVIIGGLLVFGGQWFASRQTAKLELNKLKYQDIAEQNRMRFQEDKERCESITKFRQERAKPVFEALDRVSHMWDSDSYFDLAESLALRGKTIDPNDEEYKKKQEERKTKRFQQIVDDISACDVIQDTQLRNAITKLIRNSIDPDMLLPEGSMSLDEVYTKLENWIFNPLSH